MGEMIQLELDSGEFPAYLVGTEGQTKGGLIVIHEVWGLDDHIRDVAERFAGEGYTVLAPDLLSGSGMDQAAASKLKLDLFDPEKRTEAQPKLRALMSPISAPEFGQVTLAKLRACFDYLYNLDKVRKKVAVTGFCFGGSYSFSLAVSEPRLKAAAPFYGHAGFAIDELEQIKCPVMAFYGQNDKGLISDLPELKQKMKKAGVDFRALVYPNSGHAFFNNTNKFSFNHSAANDSWTKVLDFLSLNVN